MNERFAAYLSRIRTPEFATAVVGHRGASSLAPENTVAAFKSAVAAGCDLVELDVLTTKDQELVVTHDPKLGRTTDRKGVIARLTLAEIQACDAGCWFAPEFKGERVPHLREALEAIAHRAVPMIEVKQKAAKVKALVPRLTEVIQAAGYADHAVLITWDDATALALRAALPEALIARIAFTRLGIGRARRRGFDGVVPWRASTTARFLTEAQRAGIFVAPWTVNRPKDMEFFSRAGCDAVITDVPHVLRETLGRLAGGPTAERAASV